jgi:hypothetical protein
MTNRGLDKVFLKLYGSSFVFETCTYRERERTVTVPKTFTSIRSRASLHLNLNIPFTAPDGLDERSMNVFRPFETSIWPEKLKNGHEMFRDVGRSGTLDGLKRWQNHVHGTVTLKKEKQYCFYCTLFQCKIISFRKLVSLGTKSGVFR